MDKEEKQRRFLKRSTIKRQPLFQPALKSAQRPKLHIDESDQLLEEKSSTPSEYVVPYLKQEGKSGHPLDLNLPDESLVDQTAEQMPPLGEYEPSLKTKPPFKKSEYISPMGPTEETKEIDHDDSQDKPSISPLAPHSVSNRQIRTIVRRLQKTPEQFLLFQRVGESYDVT